MKDIVLMQCTECGSEETNVVVAENGSIGLFCAKCQSTMGSFPAEYDGLYDIVQNDRKEWDEKQIKMKERDSSW